MQLNFSLTCRQSQEITIHLFRNKLYPTIPLMETCLQKEPQASLFQTSEQKNCSKFALYVFRMRPEGLNGQKCMNPVSQLKGCVVPSSRVALFGFLTGRVYHHTGPHTQKRHLRLNTLAHPVGECKKRSNHTSRKQSTCAPALHAPPKTI